MSRGCSCLSNINASVESCHAVRQVYVPIQVATHWSAVWLGAQSIGPYGTKRSTLIVRMRRSVVMAGNGKRHERST